MSTSDSARSEKRASVSSPESADASGRTGGAGEARPSDKPRTRRFHLSLDVSGALKNWTRGGREWNGVVTDPETGRVLTPAEFHDYLVEQLAQGVRRIPFESKSGACEGFSPETGCPGHEIEEAPRG